jgi:undecaprenyl-diphosphatase
MSPMSPIFSYSILGLVEGVTEFIPVSSSGHLILAREWLNLVTENALAVDAVLQLATVLALIVYFWRDILNLAYTALYIVTGRAVPAQEKNLLIAIIVGTIPAVIFGLLLEKTMETLFRSPILVAYALIAGSLVMLAAEYFTRITNGAVGWYRGLVVGLFQCLALVPGMSRSAMTISGGMFVGLSRSDAARFGFILSIPILVGSGLKKLYDLDTSGQIVTLGGPLIAGSILAFISGLIAVHFLMVLVRRTPLTVFVIYRIIVAALILIFVN